MDKFDNQKLETLIELFLQINCQPSDQQFHALAEALAVDKETLESIAYEMLSEDVNDEDPEVDAVSTHFPEDEEEENYGIVNAAMRLKLTAGDNDEFQRATAALERLLGKPTTKKKDAVQWGEKGEEILYTLSTSQGHLAFQATIDYNSGSGQYAQKFMAWGDTTEELIKHIKSRVKEYKQKVHPREYTDEVKQLLKLTAYVITAGDIEPEEGLSEQQEVLQGEGDPATTNTDNLMLTDGAPAGETTDDEMQDSLLVDGVGEDDTGVGIETDKSMLLNDGAPALQLTNAATRLKAAKPSPNSQDLIELAKWMSSVGLIPKKGTPIGKQKSLRADATVEELDKIESQITAAGFKMYKDGSYHTFFKDNVMFATDRPNKRSDRCYLKVSVNTDGKAFKP